MRRLVLLFWLLAPSVVAAEEAAWQPETTWVFAVGVLQFDDPALATWPNEGRVDAVMLDAFRRRGVPDKQIVFILDGKPALDLDADGRITFTEAAKHCDLEMAFCENQRAGRATTGDFSPETVMAQTQGGPNPPRVGERCEGFDEGKWWKVKILDVKDGKYLVHWIGWDRSSDAWIGPDRMRAFKPATMAKGAKVEIEWNKTWYKGRVLKSELGLHLVHYDGYPADDEWVPTDRLRLSR